MERWLVSVMPPLSIKMIISTSLTVDYDSIFKLKIGILSRNRKMLWMHSKASNELDSRTDVNRDFPREPLGNFRK